MLHVAVLAGAVDHLVATSHRQATRLLVVASVGDDGIIDNATVLLADERQSSLRGLEGVHVAHEDSLEELHSVLARPPTHDNVRTPST